VYGDDLEIEALERTKLASARRWIMGAGMWWLLHGLIFHILFDGLYRADLARQALYVGVGLCALHAGLFFWSRRAPLPATMAALVLFIVLHGMMIAANPRILFPIRVSLFGLAMTVIWYAVRILFLVKLAQGIGAAFEIRRLRAQQPKLPVARVI
jgi:hypothetical protein